MAGKVSRELTWGPAAFRRVQEARPPSLCPALWLQPTHLRPMKAEPPQSCQEPTEPLAVGRRSQVHLLTPGAGSSASPMMRPQQG